VTCCEDGPARGRLRNRSRELVSSPTTLLPGRTLNEGTGNEQAEALATATRKTLIVPQGWDVEAASGSSLLLVHSGDC